MSPSRTRRRAATALAAAVLLLIVAWSLRGPAVSAVPGQDTSSTTTSEPTITTTEDLLEGQTTVVEENGTSTTLPGDTDEDSPAGDETRTVWLIVVGLVLVAVLLALLTWRYWKRTAPVRPAPEEKEPTSAGAR